MSYLHIEVFCSVSAKTVERLFDDEVLWPYRLYISENCVLEHDSGGAAGTRQRSDSSTIITYINMLNEEQSDTTWFWAD